MLQNVNVSMFISKTYNRLGKYICAMTTVTAIYGVPTHHAQVIDDQGSELTLWIIP